MRFVLNYGKASSVPGSFCLQWCFIFLILQDNNFENYER
jgi:hypothetical protein